MKETIILRKLVEAGSVVNVPKNLFVRPVLKLRDAEKDVELEKMSV